MIETKKKKIDGVTYKVMQMDAIRGLMVETKLIKLLGPSIGKTLISGQGSKDKKAMLDKAIGFLVENFDDKEVANFVIGLFDKGVFHIDKDGDDSVVDFKSHFTGKPLSVWKVAFFILKVNFGDILGKLVKGSKHLQKIASEFQNES